MVWIKVSSSSTKGRLDTWYPLKLDNNKPTTVFIDDSNEYNRILIIDGRAAVICPYCIGAGPDVWCMLSSDDILWKLGIGCDAGMNVDDIGCFVDVETSVILPGVIYALDKILGLSRHTVLSQNLIVVTRWLQKSRVEPKGKSPVDFDYMYCKMIPWHEKSHQMTSRTRMKSVAVIRVAAVV